MKINHINLGLSDVPAAAEMFEKYFGFTRLPGSPSPKMAFMTDDAGSLISLFKVDDAVYPKIFHIGFMLETSEQVNAMHTRLLADGFDPGEPKEEHGRFTFYFHAPGGVMIEVNSPVDSGRIPLREAVSLNEAS